MGLFVDAFPPLMDGVASVVLNYAENLKKMGDEVHVIAGDYGKATKHHYDEEHGWDFVYRLPVVPFVLSKPYGILRVRPCDYKAMDKIKFDIIHIHSPFYTGKMGLKVAKKQNVPVIGTLHSQFERDIMAATHNSKFLTHIVMNSILKVFNKCDVLWAVSNASRDMFMKPPYNLKNVGVSNNACDFKIESEEELNIAISKAKAIIGKECNEPILLFVGQQHDKKNIPHILESLNIIKKRGCKFKAIFVGQGPHLDKYKRFVSKNSLENEVMFTGLITDRSAITGFYALSYMLLFPSYYDTACLVKREAAYFNVPTLFGKGSVTSEGVEDMVNGYYADDSPESMADKIEWALTHPEEHKKIGEKARITIYSTWEDRLKEVRERYVEIINNYKKSGTIK